MLEQLSIVRRGIVCATHITSPRFCFQGKADGQRSVVWLRARLQDQLSQLGYFLQRHAGKVLFVAVLALAILCVALKSAQVNSKVEQLWVQGKRLSCTLDRFFFCGCNNFVFLAF